MIDELTVPEPTGIAVLTDPQLGRRPGCPCGGCPGARVVGAMPGWHLRKGPAPLLSAHLDALPERRSGLRTWDFLEQGNHGDPRTLFLPSWIDHRYRLRLPGGRWCYVAEPYELYGEAFADLAFLESSGFDVGVRAWRARHYPGHTVAVEIVERAA